jgi:thiamine biosynthesis lipoprotein
MKRLFIIVFCITFVFTGCSIPKVEKNIEQTTSFQKESIASSEKNSDKLTPQEKADNDASLKTSEETSKEAVLPPQNFSKESNNLNLEKLTSKRKTSYNHFNTICFAVVFDDFNSNSALARFENTWQEIDAMLTLLERKLSVNIVGSDIYKFNESKCGERVAISNLTGEIVSKAFEMYELTEGAYNPAVSNLVDLWGFSPRFLNNEDKKMPYDRQRNEKGSFDLPDKRYIEAFKALSDFSSVKLTRNESGGYYLTKNAKDIEVDGVLYSQKIDLGGIAKGYGADKATEILKKNGYEYGYVNLGLSSMSLLKRNVSDKGAPNDNMWSINMANPYNLSENYLTGFGKDAGVSTSGTYEVQYSINGREYSHIIDPNTGEPTKSDILSVSIWGGEASNADALTTALCVMGKEKAVEFMNTHLKDYRVAFIIRNGANLELVTNMTDGEYLLY